MANDPPQTGPRARESITASTAASAVKTAAGVASGARKGDEDPDASKVWIEGKEYDLESDFTFDEMIVAEELVEMDIEVALNGGARMKALAVLVYLLRKRDNPDFTFEDAKQLKVKATVERPT